MSFVPVVPISGYAGWTFLNRTMEKQQAAFTASASIQRDEDYFRERIGQIDSAEDLVADRRLLQVALGAFGLDADIDNRFFIKKVLEDGTLSSDALSNKLADKQYLEFSKAFGFGDNSELRTKEADFADTILSAYETRQFEVAVGETDDSFRLALNAQREMPELAAKSNTETTKWLSILGSEPLRTVFENALGLPSSISAIDLDQQVTAFSQKAELVFGSSDPALFSDSEQVDKLVRLYLLRSQAQTSTLSGGSVALQLLQSSENASGTLSLLL